ncbi:hypothetical protein HR45_05740 [Shewanella mangrovi]|uniref:Uncharacterized protein n=1 Tax=Shewanella mangrovi TaxID=1515746 RepID=A0A094LS44_9GAMM|nr:hypothetical protein [Shewanella mangrovi]KFZ38013.1 hypothetical protein HR45_05740 [Shewanella mangrovi]
MNQQLCGLAALLLCSFPALANGNNSVNSELGHFSGGLLTSGMVTAISSYYWPQQNRVASGFWLPTSISTLEEFREFSTGDNTAGQALLDASCFALGAWLGSYGTDRYLLAPAVHPDGDHGRYVGLQFNMRF